jgi:hypothetical protein
MTTSRIDPPGDRQEDPRPVTEIRIAAAAATADTRAARRSRSRPGWTARPPRWVLCAGSGRFTAPGVLAGPLRALLRHMMGGFASAVAAAHHPATQVSAESGVDAVAHHGSV